MPENPHACTHHDFEEKTGFFKNRRICRNCGYKDEDWGTGIVASVAAIGLATLFALGAIFGDPDYPGTMDG